MRRGAGSSRKIHDMKFYSTQNKSLRAGFREATIKGQPEERGLYFPCNIPDQSVLLKNSLDGFSNEEIAFQFLNPYTVDDIPKAKLEKIIKDALSFEFPLIQITDSIASLELFHGPTLAFKDVGARFMSRCLGYFAETENRRTTVLVATSGDTGGAVADAFNDVDGVEVIILFPDGKVSSIQETQLTTHGENVYAIAVEGNFDDCQQMVKRAFTDTDLQKKLHLTSANSINVARWLPQQVYYLFAWKQWRDKRQPPVISVPSGNFGNICAGLLAFRSGLPVKHFIAACNANDTVPEFLKNGKYKAKKATATISNAMDVGDPSNFVRISELFGNDFHDLKNSLSATSISDKQTKAAIQKLYKHYKYLADPHGAVGYHALEEYITSHPGTKGYFLETAHPVKFYDVVEPVIGEKVPLPDSINGLLMKKKRKIGMKSEYLDLKEFLMRM
jgi:threonine synthase